MTIYLTPNMQGPLVRASLVLIAALSASASAPAASAQTPTSMAAVSSWLAFDAPPGEESRITDAVLAADGHWHRDQLGNLIMTVGSGHPRRLIACGLDHVGFIVSGVTDQGYIRLHRAGNAATHPLWDQFHQAQQVRILTRNGTIPGVVAVDNVHFAQEHRGDTSVVNVDQLWVDIGARSRREVATLGVSLIDPVVRDLSPWRYTDYLAGADASGRAGCAAVAAIAHAARGGAKASGETVFVLSVQSSFAWRGLEGAIASLGKFDEATLVTAADPARHDDATAISRSRFVPHTRGTPDVDADSISRIVVRTRFPGTLVESARASDLDSLLGAVGVASGVHGANIRWLSLREPSARIPVANGDSLSRAAEILTSLVELPAVGAREAPVRDAIRNSLPDWARKQAVQDSAGDLIVAMGPDRDTTVFLAHMDEVGYIVRAIEKDGTVTLTPQGGLNGAAWEGQPALLFLDQPSAAHLAGVFVPREQARLRRPETMSAWFGMDSVALAAHGVHAGLVVTAYKRGERLASTRFTARALDDRAGDTALLLALASINPAKLTHKVIFVWSTEEELGLFGAAAVASRIGTSVHRAYAIDTFVSSDTPLESPTFAFAPLGDGPVLRASDDGMIMLRSERARVVEVARANRIPLQVGTTKGATDADPFVARGALATQLGWPGRYSHSPAEVLDLSDLRALAQLVRTLAQ
ncbi:MAG TPA: M20/M25/M40 family metallo-hydrolase [Gemmatimonadaceae bacterium]